MADRETISRIAKILARGTSGNPGEADAAIDGAYKRMVRDRVTIKDLLTLPLVELYQEALIKLVFVVLENQTNLTPPERRKAIENYMALITARFAETDDTGNPSKQHDSPTGAKSGEKEDTKSADEEQRRQTEQTKWREEERKRAEEARREDEQRRQTEQRQRESERRRAEEAARENEEFTSAEQTQKENEERSRLLAHVARERLERTKRFFFVALKLDIAATILVIVCYVWAIGVIEDISSGVLAADPSLLGKLATVDNFYWVLIFTTSGVGLGLLKWLDACYGYAKAGIGATGFQHDSDTAIYWLIPLLNLFRPYQIFREIYKAGATDYTLPADWKKVDSSGFLLTWWIFWAATHFIWFMAGKEIEIVVRPGTFVSHERATSAAELYRWVLGSSVVVALLWFAVAGTLTRRLLDRPSLMAGIGIYRPRGRQIPAFSLQSWFVSTDLWLAAIIVLIVVVWANFKQGPQVMQSTPETVTTSTPQIVAPAPPTNPLEDLYALVPWSEITIDEAKKASSAVWQASVARIDGDIAASKPEVRVTEGTLFLSKVNLYPFAGIRLSYGSPKCEQLGESAVLCSREADGIVCDMDMLNGSSGDKRLCISSLIK